MSHLNNPNKWVRAEDGIIGGVCLSLARELQVEPWLVRAAWLMSLMFLGTGLVAYIICVIALPRTDRLPEANETMIMGVCIRLAKRSNLEIGLVRLLALTSLFVSLGGAIIGYIVLHFMLHDSSTNGEPSTRKSII
jgi:phage shock protein PspC (stress-responsive transcriptional regulator)